MKKIYLFLMIPVVVILVCSFSIQQKKSARMSVANLQCKAVENAPIIDGVVDNLWSNADALTVALGETNNPPNDPSKVGNCAGCHAFNSAVSVTLKAVYTSDRIYILATWPDSTASFTRGGSWSFADGSWKKPNSGQSEDRISFFWPMGEITGTYNTGGCMTKCHMYYPTDTDPHVSSHGIVDDAFLDSGRADMWHSKAARCDANISATVSDITVNEETHEITAGTYSTLGYADDKYVDVWAHDSINGEDGGRYGDAGTSTYSHNRIGDKSRPKYIEKAPTDFADAMFLKQSEIDNNECVGDSETGVSDADAAIYWPNYANLKAVVPERIIRTPAGSRGDLDLGTTWKDGTWTAEFSRELINGNDDDVQFEKDKDYLFNVAQLSNSRHGYEHRTSQTYNLHFLTTGIDRVNIPDSYKIDNYPNPFISSTNIYYELPKAGMVNLTVYNIAGQKMETLVNEEKDAGNYTIRWNAGMAKPGLYIYRLTTNEFTLSKKCEILKN